MQRQLVCTGSAIQPTLCHTHTATEQKGESHAWIWGVTVHQRKPNTSAYSTSICKPAGGIINSFLSPWKATCPQKFPRQAPNPKHVTGMMQPSAGSRALTLTGQHRQCFSLELDDHEGPFNLDNSMSTFLAGDLGWSVKSFPPTICHCPTPGRCCPQAVTRQSMGEHSQSALL